MTLSYRTRRFLSRLAIAAVILALAAVVVWMVWIVWLDRFVVYSRDGAQLRFDSSAENLSGEIAQAPESDMDISIFYDDGSIIGSTSTELTQIIGYYADTAALREDLSAVSAQIRALPAGTAVMIDVKNINGYFHYSSTIGPVTDTLDVTAMDELLEYMNSSGLYTIARLPAFRDYYFGLNQTSNGLFHSSRGYLYADESNCYWLDPTKDGTINYLTQIVGELKRMGFDEVVFSDFCFPDTDKIYFEGDRTTALATAADTLATICASDSFCVSFTSTNAAFQLPEGERCRLYLTGVSAVSARSVAQSTGLADPEVRVVFLTELGDTRFDEFSVMRPLSSARTTE